VGGEGGDLAMNNSLVIKNLAFALEALSRIGGSRDQLELCNEVSKLLKTEIKLSKAENTTPISPLPPLPQTDNYDDIPF
jgi:hypothetical protein